MIWRYCMQMTKKTGIAILIQANETTTEFYAGTP